MKIRARAGKRETHRDTAGQLPSVSVDVHNQVLRAAYKRADELEGRLADAIRPILHRAGIEAAKRFEQLNGHTLTASAGRPLVLTAADLGVTNTSTMVCVKPRPEQAAALADMDGTPPEYLHVTLCYLGELEGPLQPVADALQAVRVQHAPLAGVIGGYGQFGTPDGPVGILLPDVPGLVELRTDITRALMDAGLDYSRSHGFLAHLTVDSEPEDDELEMMLERYGQPINFDALCIVRGDVEVIELPFVGVPPLTAAGGPAGWNAPAGDELIDVQALVAMLRGRTDPIRQAVARELMGAALNEVGISFDITNPFAAKVLAQSGSQIVGIAETTRANAMRIVTAAHEEGLSVPDTAALIRAGMAEASQSRSIMIARTELAAAANGGSLAATQIVAAATGDNYLKQWLTAPGAPHPRHEEYEGLDGQTVPLDDYFDVGGAKLAFPGDPDGPPDEVIQCRCTLVYVSAADAAAGAEGTDEGDSGGGPVGEVPLTDDTAAVEDTVSVGTGAPVAADVLRVIEDKGLNVYEPQKGPMATAIFGTEKDTFALYSHDGEFSAEREALHDEIVAAHFAGKVASEEREAYFTAGGSASGKSALRFSTRTGDVSLEELAARRDVIHIDPDAIKEMLPEYARMRDAGDAYAAAGVHEESSILAKRIMDEALSRGYSVVSDTTGSSARFVERLESFHQAGYEVRVSMVSVPTNEAITRSIVRGGHSGRYVAIPHLKDAHSGASVQLARWQDKQSVQEWRLYDNSGTHAELVAHGGGGVVEVLDPAKWEAILAKANE